MGEKNFKEFLRFLNVYDTKIKFTVTYSQKEILLLVVSVRNSSNEMVTTYISNQKTRAHDTLAPANFCRVYHYST